MAARRAVAFFHDPIPRVQGHALAFAAGCARHGVGCEVMHSRKATEPLPGVDAIWHYGLGEGGLPFRTYAGKALRVGGDAGVWRRLTQTKFIRISVEGPQLGPLMSRRPHDFKRFEALAIPPQPKPKIRGKHILVTGRSKYDAAVHGQEYGEWERAMFAQLREVTQRPIVFRPKPKNESIPHPGIEEDRQRDCNASILGAWAVVCRSGNIGADAILLNVPVWAESGPGAVYRNFELERIDFAQPLDPDARRKALADIAAWQFTDVEIARGDLWAHLRDEGLL